jgi:CHASE2 domain-containing sensor protein
MGWGAGKMAFREEHDMHKRRFSRNVGLGLVLIAFVALVFGLTVVKVMNLGEMQAFDHVVRPELVPNSERIPVTEAPRQ